MKNSFKRLLSVILAIMMVVSSLTFTVAVSAATYADASTATGAKISEPTHNNPLDYKVGEDIVFNFSIKSGSTVYTAHYLSYSAVMDDGRTLTGYVEPVDGVYTVTLKGGLLRPGFVMMTVKACDANKAVLSNVSSYVCGAGADVDKIQSIYGIPDEYSEFGDFDAFWDETLAQLDKEGGEATIQYIYKCDPVTKNGVVFDCYELEINCPIDEYYNKTDWCGTNHVQAYLTVPQGAEKGSLKMLLDFKGYDWISASGSKTSIAPQSGICNEGYVTLSVSPHSVPAPHNVAENADATYVSDGAYNSKYYTTYLAGKYGYASSHGKDADDNASPHTTYFKYMLMRDVQAANFLMLYFGENGVAGSESWAGLWDGVNLKTNGPSQGGYQAISVAGLVPEVNEVTASVPWFGDQGVESKDSDRYTPTSPRGFGYYEALRYVDTANLASRISTDCSVTIKAGLIDTIVPPSTIMSIYDNIDASVTLTFWQNNGHSVGSGPYTQSISKNANTSTEQNTINYITAFDNTFTDDFNAAWAKVCDENGVKVDIYAADKNTTLDFAAIAAESTADAVGVVLTGDGLTNINAKLSEIYALHNDVNSKVWVIGNDVTPDGENAAITLDACMNWGDRPTGNGSIKLYTSEGALGQTSVLGANEPYAVITSPLWISARGIITETNNVTLENGMLTTSVDEASVTFSAPGYSATYEMTGVGDAAAYGNIEGVGLWVAGKDGTLTIKGAGEIPTYESYSATPWASQTFTNVVVSEGITSVGAYAFASGNAVEVNLPLSVAAIDATAIGTDATIVSYDNSYAKTFADANKIAFTNLGATGSAGTDLTWFLDLDTGIMTISGTGTTTYSGSGGYSNDKSKESLSVFWPYKDKINTVKFGDSVTTIGGLTFYALDGIKTVELTKNINTIGSSAFGNCKNLSTIYVQGNEPVAGTYDLSYVTIMSGGYQFDGSGKSTLKEVIFSDNLSGALGDKFISYNESLESITIPAGVTGFSSRTIHRCTALKEITFLGDTTLPSNFLLHKDEQTDSSDPTKGYKTYIDVVYGKAGSSAEAWVTTTNASYAANSIDHEMTFVEIEDVVAKGKAGVDLYWKIVDEDDVRVMYIYGTGTKIQPYITAEATFDTSISWNEDHSQYDWHSYASSVQKLVIEAPVTEVQGYSFDSFNKVTTLELPQTMTTTSYCAFNAMEGLTTVYTTGQTPVVGTANLSAISTIGDYSFVKSAFSKVILAEGVSIGSYAFEWNTSLSELELPENIKSIGSKSFTAYSDSTGSLTTVTFPKSLATVPYSAFVKSSDNKTVYANDIIASITVKNPEAVFEGATTEAPYTAFLNNMVGITTVYGYGDSTAKAMVEWTNENTDRTLEYVDIEASVVASGSYSDADWVVNKEPSGEYTLTISGNATILANKSDDWGFSAFDTTKVTKVVITAPITIIGGSSEAVIKSVFTNCETIELPITCKTIGSHAFNGMKSLKTVYTTGQEAVAGTFNLTNITAVNSWSIVFCVMDTLIFGENTTVHSNALYWTPNLKTIKLAEGIKMGKNSFVSGDSTERIWDVTSIEFPASMSVIPAESFNRNDGTADTGILPNNTITEIIVNNPDALFANAADATADDYETFVTKMSALETVKGYRGSTAEKLVIWANEYFAENEIDRTIEFIPFGIIVDEMPIGDDLWYRIIDNGDETYTIDIYGTGTTAYAADADGNKVTMSWDFIDANRSFNTYASKITKIKISGPNVTAYQGYMFKGTQATHLELNPNLTKITGGSDFNGIKLLTTVYVTGNEPVEGVADLSNITAFGDYAFVNHKFKKIILSDELTTVPYYCFGSDDGAAVLEAVEIPASVTSLNSLSFSSAKNLIYVNIGGDNVNIASNAFNGCSAYATIIGKPGSSAETFAVNNGYQFIDSSLVGEIVYTYAKNNSTVIFSKVDDSNYTAFASGSATAFDMGYTNYNNAIAKNEAGTSNGPDRPWGSTVKDLITKVVFVNPNLISIDATFAVHKNLRTVEVPASLSELGYSAFNQSAVDTLYITGNEPVEGVVDLSNVTKLGSMCLASCLAKSILLSDDLTGEWGNNLFFKCSNLEYIRIPKGVTGSTNTPFDVNVYALKTVLVENPDFAFSDGIFAGAPNVKTIIGYTGSTAQTFATNKGLTFIPIDAAGALTFDGFQIRESGYNGLRSLYSANLTEIGKREAAGLTVVEFGSVIASTDKLTSNAVDLTVWVDENGNIATHDFAMKFAIMNGGEFTNAKVLSSSDSLVEYACTVINFNESNYNKNITFRGYIVFADSEGNEYIVYADLLDDNGSSTDADGNSYGTTSLDATVARFETAGTIDLEANICYIDVKKFRESTVN